MNIKPFAFVLMPFAKEFEDIYKLGIQALAAEHSIVAERVDEQIYTETMLERIYRQIEAADFIIADLTGKNPNVYYELGYAHAKQKLCTLLTQRSDEIPFDLKHHRHLVYDGNITKLRKMLAGEFEWLKTELASRRATTISISLKSAHAELNKESWFVDVDVDFKFDIHNRTERRSPDIEAIYVHTGKKWRLTQNGETCPHTDSTLKEGPLIRHFLKTPVPRLSPGAWAQLVFKGNKRVWSKYLGTEEIQEPYPVKGNIYIEVVTSEGNFVETILIDEAAEEIPF